MSSALQLPSASGSSSPAASARSDFRPFVVRLLACFLASKRRTMRIRGPSRSPIIHFSSGLAFLFPPILSNRDRVSGGASNRSIGTDKMIPLRSGGSTGCFLFFFFNDQ
jgi:hypothetical protein